jgi:N-acetylmuramoyl-L-alanine amidase
MIDIIDSPSPNFDERELPITMLVLHYTGMEDAAASIAWLKNPASKVSCHYLVSEDGQILRMVPEEKRAWHAGRSWWRGVQDVNSASIGIEIVNPGHQWGYRPFPDEQIDALVPLVAEFSSGTRSPAAMSSAIPTSRRRASRIRASSFRGIGLPASGWPCRARRRT